MATFLLPVMATFCRGVLLWNQVPSGEGKFNTASVYHSWTADDFLLETVLAVNKVSWWGGRGGDTLVIDGFHIRLCCDGVGLATDQHVADQLLLEETVFGDASRAICNSETYSCSATLSIVFNAAANQHYWLSIQADTQHDPNDPWWGWQVSNTFALDSAEYNSTCYSHHPVN